MLLELTEMTFRENGQSLGIIVTKSRDGLETFAIDICSGSCWDDVDRKHISYEATKAQLAALGAYLLEKAN